MTKIDLSLIKFDEKGLVPVVVQDVVTAEVLMTAWANAESLAETAECGEMVFWSRSRGELWHKGETSGSRMCLRELR
ncbi:MAG: bifunctional phosphoribosyl-AMP cyclohydrolase/phosphoribosyl-ATP pyrophosphatase, partial [Cloacibacillus sp.]|nr:bifunctional phosphoribosyl-AMP cyclohydrolase/phosphoribosyl-ATP pyrophosphatase [Cloacibacillus sp.]